MTSERRRELAVLFASILSLLAVVVAQAAARPKTVVVLPFAAVDLTGDEQWIGEGVAQSLMLGFAQAPGVVPVDRERVNRLGAPATGGGDQAALSAARALGADLAVYGEVRRSWPDLLVQPRYVEVKGDRVDRIALDPVAVADGTLIERLSGLPLAYARALKLGMTDADVARVKKWAGPTTSSSAFEAFVRGQQAAYRGGQDGNEAAIELLGKAIEIDPQFAVAQYTLGAVHQGVGNRWKAQAQFRASLQIEPAYAEPYKSLGDLSLSASKRLPDQAIEAYSKALEIRPFYADAQVGLGDARAAKGETDGAIAAYQRALTYNPVNARVHVSLGKLYYSEKSLYHEAVQAYKKAIDLDGTYVDARMGLAELYEDKGLYQDAIAEYRKVIELDKKNTSALYSLALVHEKVDTKEAVALWERYIELASPLPSEKDWVDTARMHLRKLRSQPGKAN